MYSDYNILNQFYGLNTYDINNSRVLMQDMKSGEIITLNEAINLIRKSVSDEREDELFYDRIINMAPTEKEKNIIREIRDDEKRHNNILRNLYFSFTGQMLPQSNYIPNTKDTNKTYKEELEKALFGELDAVKKYRKILGVMPNDGSYTLLMSIMTDEIRHAIKYNFLINMAK